jgi:hypothetical protein
MEQDNITRFREAVEAAERHGIKRIATMEALLYCVRIEVPYHDKHSIDAPWQSSDGYTHAARIGESIYVTCFDFVGYEHEQKERGR